MKRGLLIFLLLPLVYGLGFEGYFEPDDPIPCGGLTTFEDNGEYLRDVYVSSSGSAIGDGSQTNPYNSLVSATSNAQPGDIIHMTGSFSGGLTITDLHGTAEHPIQIVGPATFSGGSQCAQFVRAQYVVIRDITCHSVTSNGFNFDDGGDMDGSANHIIFDDIEIYNIGTGGNQDCLKLSGLENFIVKDSYFHDGSAGGSGIDMVGCHDGIIMNNEFNDLGSNFIQAKGGTEDITIHGNLMVTADARGVNMGGSTGFVYFRPPVADMDEPYEAKHIRVTSNIFIDPNSAFGYVGCDECLAANNLIYRPRTWIFRILQETTTLDGYDFVPSRRGEFVNNIIVFRQSDVTTLVNIGPNTQAETFRMASNLWYVEDNSNYNYNFDSRLADEVNPVHNVDPLLDFNNLVLDENSPAFDAGESGWVNTDYYGNCFETADVGPFARPLTCEDADIRCVGSGQEYSTIQDAVDDAGAGDEIIVYDGEYGDVRIDADGTISERITIRAATEHQATVSSFDVNGDYITIQDLQIQNSDGTDCIDIDGSNVDILNNRLPECRRYAVVVGGSNNLVKGNYIYKPTIGIPVSGTDNIVEDNEIEGLYQWGILGDCDYTRFFGDGHIFRNNYFHGMVRAEVGDAHVDCFQTFDNHE